MASNQKDRKIKDLEDEISEVKNSNMPEEQKRNKIAELKEKIEELKNKKRTTRTGRRFARR